MYCRTVALLLAMAMALSSATSLHHLEKRQGSLNGDTALKGNPVCAMDGVTHKEGETWTTPCMTCFCQVIKGHPDHVCYSTTPCVVVKCKADQHKYRAPGACCDECISNEDHCSIINQGCNPNHGTPVCSKSGITYPTQCAFTRQNCLAGDIDSIAHGGACIAQTASTDRSQQAASNENSSSSEGSNDNALIISMAVIAVLLSVMVIGGVAWKKSNNKYKRTKREQLFNDAYSVNTNDSSCASVGSSGTSSNYGNSTVNMESVTAPSAKDEDSADAADADDEVPQSSNTTVTPVNI